MSLYKELPWPPERFDLWFAHYDDDPLEVPRSRWDRIDEALDELPPRMREVTVMSIFGGHTHREIAEQCGLSRSWTSNLISEGKKRLRESLESVLLERHRDLV